MEVGFYSRLASLRINTVLEKGSKGNEMDMRGPTFNTLYRVAAVGFNLRVQYPSFSPLIKWMLLFSNNLLFQLHFKAILDNTKDFERQKIILFD